MATKREIDLERSRKVEELLAKVNDINEKLDKLMKHVGLEEEDSEG